jgi:sterol desaturase/sphingolipid hydroxylase (fatty acid hydroxylase superfamily)
VYDFVSQASFPVLAAGITAALIGLNVVWSGIGMLAERAFRDYRIWQIDLKPGQIRREILANLRFDTVVGLFIAALLAFGWVRIAPSDATSATLSFGACWIGFEVYYWGVHRAMHTRPLYRFHRWHHESRVTTPFTGVSTSSVEAIFWAIGFGLAPVLLSTFTTVSLTGWALYFLYNYSGNIVGHINAELFPKVLNRRGQSWMTHPITYHALHHARFVNHYSFGSSFMDRLLGTEWDDWPMLHERVRDRKPMTSLAQRGA